jgi:hypothetical protein
MVPVELLDVVTNCPTTPDVPYSFNVWESHDPRAKFILFVITVSVFYGTALRASELNDPVARDVCTESEIVIN